MSRLTRSLAGLALALGVAPPAHAGDTVRRLCPEDAPEGVRLPVRAGCPGRQPDRARVDDGFREVGGIKIRVGGRVSLDHDMRR